VHGLSGHTIKQIEASRHSAAITEDGRLYVWGPVFKGDKPLLLPQELRSNKLMIKISIGEKISAVIDEDNHVYTWGNANNLGQLGRR
jgi:alpha-tubulin suppressor-like RCC1 family protein